MLVVQEIEQRLPLPPFEVWVADYLKHRETYRLYAHALHREGVLRNRPPAPPATDDKPGIDDDAPRR